MKQRIEYFDSKFETMSKDELLEFQFHKFKEEIGRAWQENAFYRKKYTAAGMRPENIKTREDIADVPVTVKEELVEDARLHPPYGSRLQIPSDKIVLVVETSGTSGRGQETHPLSFEDTQRIYEAQAYGFFWAGVRSGTVVMLTYPIGLTAAPVWFYGAMQLLRANVFNIGRYSTKERIAYMQRFGIDVLQCSSPYLRTLEYAAREIGIDPRSFGIKSMIMSGGGLSPQWIARAEETWGAKIFEQYACSGKAITWTCEYGMLPEGLNGRKGMIHWLPHMCLIEVIDPSSGKQVESGSEGEIIITPLGYGAAPLIRFATGDRGTFLSSDYCPCARPFDGFECNSVGRYDDMIKVKGVNVWQGALDKVIFRFPTVLEYMGEVVINELGREEAIAHLQLKEALNQAQKERLFEQIAGDLRENTGIGFTVKEWSGAQLFDPAKPDKKLRRWKDKRGEK